MKHLEEIDKKNKNDYNLINNTVEKINLNDFHIGQKVCKCKYGYVSLCKRVKTNKIYSLKILKKARILEDKFVERQYNEYKNMAIIYHPFIIELKGINFTDPFNLYYLAELVPGGPLRVYLKIYQTFPLEFAKFYSASLITVLDYLHKKNIIHRDIRPENIILNNNGYIKLSEFIFSKQLKSDMTYSIVGIPEYYSPEMINKSGYNKCIDFWQLGILLYEMLIGKTPFMHSDPVEIYKKINCGKIYFPKNINKDAKKIIKQFLNINKNKRLGCTNRGIYEIINHPFYKDFDWEELLYRKMKPPFLPIITKYNDHYDYKKIDDYLSDENKEALPKEIDPFYNWQ